ncbi:protein Jumonji [Neodiprion fabricii]|uniref:protein Jumonji n=1 Tax=Neodiprion fabricii TaxID=2872261 RepID=UPI001ED91012|nr:protein Jumonji [Neodiprion fabricii]
MVLSRNDKRKRREGDLVDLMDPLSESPKRTKVHAQRKFAQGVATIFGSTQSSIKEKEKAKPAVITELITHGRPNTEDFLTFLCFRGTPMLPPSLDFFNVGSRKVKQGQKSSISVVKKPIPPTSTSGTETPKSTTSTQKSNGKGSSISTDKKITTSEKNMTKFKTSKMAASAVEALKKKYQEQRLAKQRIKNKFKPTCIMRTRSSTDRAKMKTASIVPPKKFLPKVETKRHCLRSSAIANKSKNVGIIKGKVELPKAKKRSLVRERCNDSSNTDVSSDDNSPTIRAMLRSKRQTRHAKKVCTRSKSETRRITRSHRETIQAQVLSRRPSRKTKEAAAVYMEILGRKLVSPDLDNEDNLSVDSFPELPNARRIAQRESEIRAKVKQTSKLNSNKDAKSENSRGSSTRFSKDKVDRSMVKNKRPLKIQKYCELDSEDDSACSVQSENIKPVTRRSLGKLAESTSRSLRSSPRNVPSKLQSEKSTKTEKEKVMVKRKRDQNSGRLKESLVKTSVPKQKSNKSKSKSDNSESDEETLGMLLDKMMKKKKKNEPIKSVKVDKAKSENTPPPNVDDKYDTSKISDDEESFRGFSNKAISKVLNSCHTHVKANLLASEEDSRKLDVLKTHGLPETDAMNIKNKPSSDVETSDSLPVTINVNESSTKPIPEDLSLSEIKSAPPVIPVVSMNVHEIYNHNPSDSTVNIIDMPRSSSLVRKERVNMSTEQIEKWLNESSMAKEESKAEMENVSGFKFEDTVKVKNDVSHISISTRIQHLVRPVNISFSKTTEKNNYKYNNVVQNKIPPILNVHVQHSPPKQQGIPTNRNRINADIKEIIKGRNMKTSKDSSFGEDSDAVSKSDHNSIDGSPDKKSPDKKSFQPRKPFLPKVKERKDITPSANAFSPENESSVYAFESDNETPISTPFRRRLKDTDNKPDSVPLMSEEEAAKTEEETQNVQNQDSASADTPKANQFELPKIFADLATMQVLPIDKLTTSWSNVGCSTSIAVQVNLDEQSQEPQTTTTDESILKSTEISTQTDRNNDNEDDNDGGQLFYIPLQAVTRNGPNLVQGQQLIQGVAVKLGTEGPTGPNQRVLLRAKLITKPPSTVARCPPVGTVQPTARVPQNSSTSGLDNPAPSTSTSVVPTPSTSNFQHPLSNKSFTLTQTTQHQNASTATGTSVVPDKVQKSPKASRERKTSIDSVKSGKRSQSKSKPKTSEFCSPSNPTTFPSPKNADEEARLVEAPTFHPTEKDFQDPLEYIDKIRPIAEKFGICRVVPPVNFKPECKVSDDMRFTAYNQYVHRMLHRWGPNVKEMMAIKKYLATQSITLTHPPWIGGMEVDLPHLYQTVQSLGGLKEVIEKKKWQKVADGMKIPKSAQDRVTKLDDIYCKYLLPYDTLSPEEREKLFDEVETDWAKRESKALQTQTAPSSDNDAEDDDEDSSDETEECIVKGRNMPLNAFYRIARNTQRMWFGESQPPSGEAEGAAANEVEAAFWKHVAERKRHVCVHAASIDSSGRGFGFSVAKNSPFARHPWNLKVLTNNAGSVLRALGPLMGVTVPTLHVGMLFSACCWYRDPHGLPWIEYLHTGAKKIWYGIPDEHSDNFRDALAKMVPRYCKNKTIWLPSDTAMVPPELLVKNGVPLCQTVQEPGQFIIVFPKAFTSSICTGYVVSESVYFAQSSWLVTAEQVFKDIQESCEPSIFSFERLLFSIINDTRSHVDVLKQILPTVMNIRERELEYRRLLGNAGLTNTERLPLPDSGKRRRGKKVKEDDSDFECETCRANLFVSLVSNLQDDCVYCLPHACQILTRKKQLLKHSTLMYTYSEAELDDLIHKLEDKIEAKSKKTNQMRQAK